ncbi:response regulator [Fulvivirga sp. RKSG066]|uniref:response regulator n=1 Tax=Fulvivirga aurantia TaxID=2529383 RepID=UPI0012BD1E17|nr:response regulator [Fulvivirga aurantia]MTI19875.1 response regulator [Fulvivirga aurantia]
MIKITSIIIAEDDADDRLLIEDALNENAISSDDLVFVEDGEELLDKLKDNVNAPSMVFLDLNMPKKDGRQALKEIKEDDRFKHIPVIVFSTSNSADDIITSYKNGVNTYFTKPSKYSDLLEIIKSVKSYWWEKARLA